MNWLHRWHRYCKHRERQRESPSPRGSRIDVVRTPFFGIAEVRHSGVYRRLNKDRLDLSCGDSWCTRVGRKMLGLDLKVSVMASDLRYSGKEIWNRESLTFSRITTNIAHTCDSNQRRLVFIRVFKLRHF